MVVGYLQPSAVIINSLSCEISNTGLQMTAFSDAVISRVNWGGEALSGGDL